ncbi:MAG: undecaprenyl-diphosphate phosphatase [Oscillospiraceae bacterium]|nr:undecaprenyl-diphosphate phosphatase [Oscillospiraceae bacterium]
MSFLSAIVLGLVQGITEFLPVSSSGHLSILQNFFHFTDVEADHLFFDVLLHFGTLIAVFFAYREEIVSLFRELIELLRRKPAGKGKTDRRMILLLVVATLPLFLVLPIKDRVESLYSNTIFIGAALIVTGLLLYFSDRLNRGDKTERNATIGDVLLVGIGQALATVPGLSRSGTTISTGLCCGFDRSFAVKFSFLLSIPAVLGANILSLADAVSSGIEWSLVPMYLVGVVVAMVSGYASIRFLKRLAARSGFGGFAYYCWGVGALTLILSLIK